MRVLMINDSQLTHLKFFNLHSIIVNLFRGYQCKLKCERDDT